MGAGSSRELEAAQSQVKRLTKQLKLLNTELNGSRSRLGVVEKEAVQLKEVQTDLQKTRHALSEATQRAREASDIPMLKQEVANAKQELMRAQAGQQDKMSSLETELKASKQELEKSQQDLERVVGQLKFAQQEGKAVGRLQKDVSEAHANLSAQQDEAAKLSAQLVSEASAARLEHAGRLQDTHPIFGELLQDFGYKKLYRGSPLTLWAGTLVWQSQRAFRQERASLIAKAKARSGVCARSPLLC